MRIAIIKGDTTDNQCSPSILKQMRDTESSVEERPKFEIDLPVEGVPQYDILKDEEVKVFFAQMRCLCL